MLEREVSNMVHGVQPAKKSLIQNLVFDFALDPHLIP
jgi:hypothetical protein